MSLLSVIAERDLAASPLVKVHRLVDWAPIAAELDPIRQAFDARHGGPRPYSPVSMFRASLLQDWHRLGFGTLAWALRVRMDFQVFADFDAGRPVPSAASLRRGRLRLQEEARGERCRQMVAAQLAAAGIVIRQTSGALLDIRLRRRIT